MEICLYLNLSFSLGFSGLHKQHRVAVRVSYLRHPLQAQVTRQVIVIFYFFYFFFYLFYFILFFFGEGVPMHAHCIPLGVGGKGVGVDVYV